MLNVALALVPAGDDDRQAVFFADPVAGAADEVIPHYVAKRGSLLCNKIVRKGTPYQTPDFPAKSGKTSV